MNCYNIPWGNGVATLRNLPNKWRCRTSALSFSTYMNFRINFLKSQSRSKMWGRSMRDLISPLRRCPVHPTGYNRQLPRSPLTWWPSTRPFCGVLKVASARAGWSPLQAYCPFCWTHRSRECTSSIPISFWKIVMNESSVISGSSPSCHTGCRTPSG